MDKERKKGIQIHRSIVYGSHARLLTDEEKASGLHDPSHTHKWTVFLTSAATPPPKTTGSQLQQGRGKGKGKGKSITNNDNEGGEVIPEDIDFITGGADDLSWLIKRVAFKLHETYANFNRNIDKPPFLVTETGWGEFSISIRVQFQPETSEKTLTMSHNLKLHHWGPVVSSVGGGTGGDGGDGAEGTGVGLGEAREDKPMEDVSMTTPATQTNTPIPNPGPNPSATADPTNPKPPGSDATPTPAADADESGLTAPPDEDEDEDEDEGQGVDADGDVKMETADTPSRTGTGTGTGGGNKTADKDADGTEDDEDADAEGEDDDDDDADGEVDDADADADGKDDHPGPSLASRSQNNNEDGMDVDNPNREANASSNGNGTDPPCAPNSASASAPGLQINPLPVHSWQYDELIFSDPTPQFYDLLLSHEPTKLPLRSLRKPDSEGAGGLVGMDRGSAGVPLEFTRELERAEGDKLDEARRRVVEETDVWRQRIIELEKEQMILKEQVTGY